MSEKVREAVREQYGEIARSEGCGCSCDCSDASALASDLEPGYTEEQRKSIPEGADLGLGCGTPLAFAGLRRGETVLDLGSGGGVDCFLAAKEVGAEGHVIGVDMTADMLARARRVAEESGASNVEFRLGEIEHLPVADASVDVVVSNCVVNLSPDKAQVYRDAFRVLRPGGRIAISDIVALRELPESVRKDLTLVGACIGGAARVEEISAQLEEAGFTDVRIEPRRVDTKKYRELGEVAVAVAPATVQAVKPS